MKTTIRSSMLTTDCIRRSVAHQWRIEFEEHGFEFNQILPGIGAATGTSFHAGLAHSFRKRFDDEKCSITDMINVAVASFKLEIDDGVLWDSTTPNLATAVKQLQRMLVVASKVADHLEPALVEWEFAIPIGDDFELTGHADLITVDGAVLDHKTGAVIRPHQKQLGGYSLGARSRQQDVRSTGIFFTPRTPVSRPQADPVIEMYDQGVCERAAITTIKHFKESMLIFRGLVKDGDAHPEDAFQANPASMMCSDKYCRAHGTNFCQLGR